MDILNILFGGLFIWSCFMVYDEGFFASHLTPIGVVYRVTIPLFIIYLIFFS